VGLWRGETLAGLRGDWAARTREGWRRERLAALIRWGEAEGDAGDPMSAIGPLGDLAREHPLAEPVIAARKGALHLRGRRPEAPDGYAAPRRLLAEELGTEPEPELQRLHQAILRRDALSDTAYRQLGRHAEAIEQYDRTLNVRRPAVSRTRSRARR